MNPRDVILQAIKPNQEIVFSRPPVALLSGGTWTFRQRGLTLKDILDNPEPAAQIIADVNSEVQSDIVWPGSGYHNLLIHIFGGKIKFRPQGNIDVMEVAFDKIPTAERIDLDAIDRDEWIRSIRNIIAGVNSLVGKKYLVGTSSWGPFTLAGQFYGVEKVMSGLYKDKPGIHALMEIMTEISYRYLAPTVGPAAIISVAEPTASGDLISRRHFEEFVAPYLEKLFTRLKKDGALIMLHICGNIQDRLDLSPGLGVDLMSVDYKVNLAAAAKTLGGRTALAGNVNPVVLRDSSSGEVRSAAAKCLKDMYDYSRFVLMPGCDIPPAAPLANIQAFIAAGK